MKFYDIKNFVCCNCNCNEYDVIREDKGLLIVCSKCGREISKEQYKQLEIKDIKEGEI